VASPFHIANAGDFELQVTLPAPQATTVAQPPFGGCLHIVLKGDEYRLEREMNAFRSSGTYEFGKLSYLRSESISIPGRGDYTLHVKNCDSSLPLVHSGGMIELTRKQRPTEAYLLAAAIRGAAWTFLLLGICVAAWHEYKFSRTRRREA
jgi:hypothetical protein